MQSKKLLSALLAFVLVAICTVGFLMLGVNAEEAVTVTYNVTGTASEAGAEETTYATLVDALAAIEARTWADNEVAKVVVTATEDQTHGGTYNFGSDAYICYSLFPGNDQVCREDGSRLPVTIEGGTIYLDKINLQFLNDITFKGTEFRYVSKGYAIHAGYADIVMDGCTFSSDGTMGQLLVAGRGLRPASTNTITKSETSLTLVDCEFTNTVYLSGATGYSGDTLDNKGKSTLTLRGETNVAGVQFHYSNTTNKTKYFELNVEDEAVVGDIKAGNQTKSGANDYEFTFNMTGGKVGTATIGYANTDKRVASVTCKISGGSIEDFKGAIGNVATVTNTFSGGYHGYFAGVARTEDTAYTYGTVTNNISGGAFEIYRGSGHKASDSAEGVYSSIDTLTNNITGGLITAECYGSGSGAPVRILNNNFTSVQWRGYRKSNAVFYLDSGKTLYPIGEATNPRGKAYKNNAISLYLNYADVTEQMTTDYQVNNYSTNATNYGICAYLYTAYGEVSGSVSTIVGTPTSSKKYYPRVMQKNAVVGGDFNVEIYQATGFAGEVTVNPSVGGNYTVICSDITIGSNFQLSAPAVGGDYYGEFTNITLNGSTASRAFRTAACDVGGSLTVLIDGMTAGTKYTNMCPLYKSQDGDVTLSIKNSDIDYFKTWADANTITVGGKLDFTWENNESDFVIPADSVAELDVTVGGMTFSEAFVGGFGATITEKKLTSRFNSCTFSSDFVGAPAGYTNVSNYFDGCTFGGKMEFATEKTLENLSTGWANYAYTDDYYGDVDLSGNEYVVTDTLTNNIGEGFTLAEHNYYGSKGVVGKKVVNNVTGGTLSKAFFGNGNDVYTLDGENKIYGEVVNNISGGSINAGKADAFFGTGMNTTVDKVTNVTTGGTVYANSGAGTNPAGTKGSFYGNGGTVITEINNFLYGGVIATGFAGSHGAQTCKLNNVFGAYYAPEGTVINTKLDTNRLCFAGGTHVDYSADVQPTIGAVTVKAKDHAFAGAVILKGKIVSQDGTPLESAMDLDFINCSFSTNLDFFPDNATAETYGINGNVDVFFDSVTHDNGKAAEDRPFDGPFNVHGNFTMTVTGTEEDPSEMKELVNIVSGDVYGNVTFKADHANFADDVVGPKGNYQGKDGAKVMLTYELTNCHFAGILRTTRYDNEKLQNLKTAAEITIKNSVFDGHFYGPSHVTGFVDYKEVSGSTFNGAFYTTLGTSAGINLYMKDTVVQGSCPILTYSVTTVGKTKGSGYYYDASKVDADGKVTAQVKASVAGPVTWTCENVKFYSSANDYPTTGALNTPSGDRTYSFKNCEFYDGYAFHNRTVGSKFKQRSTYENCIFRNAGEERVSYQFQKQADNDGIACIYGETVFGSDEDAAGIQAALSRAPGSQVYVGMKLDENGELVPAETNVTLAGNSILSTGLNGTDLTGTGNIETEAYLCDITLKGSGLICNRDADAEPGYTYDAGLKAKMILKGNITIDPSLGMPQIYLTGIDGDSATVTLAEGYEWVKDQAYVYFTSADELAKVKGRTLGETTGYAKRDNANLALVGAVMTAPSVNMEVTDRISLNLLLLQSEVDDFLANAAMINWANDTGLWFRAVAGDYGDDILVEGEITAATETYEYNDVVYYKVSMGTLPAHRFNEMIELQGSTFCINQIGEGLDLTVLNLALEGAETFEKAEDKTLAKAIYNYGLAAMNEVESLIETGITVEDNMENDIDMVKPETEVYADNVSLLMGDAMGIRFSTNVAFAGKEVKAYLNGVETNLVFENAEKGYFDIFVSADEIDTEFKLVITLDGETALDATLSLKGVVERSYTHNATDAKVKAFAELAQACYNIVVAE